VPLMAQEKPSPDEKFLARRRWMVQHQLRERFIKDDRVLEAMEAVPRELFVPPESREAAYEDCPLPIGSGQTISQPYIVALMTECLRLQGEERVLEIGTGSGYQTAILSKLAQEVYTIERHEPLASSAAKRLAEIGYRNVHFRVGDGSLGWPEQAPFDRIMVTAGAPSVPEPLCDQLKDGGILAIPIGGEREQELVVVEKAGGRRVQRHVCYCQFVKLVGQEGWKVGEG